jgi:hypothetical protein
MYATSPREHPGARQDYAGWGDDVTAAGDTLARLAALPGVSTASALAEAMTRAAASGETVPVLDPLAPIVELRRGTTVAVHGSTSLLFSLLAAATRDGSWAVLVGMPSASLVSAAELGVELSRLAVLPQPGGALVTVLGALLDGLDLVVVGPALCRSVPSSVAQRLSRRARNRGSLLLAAGPWPGAELELRCEPGHWHGGTPDGRGYLQRRDTVVHRTGRGGAARAASAAVQLPGPGGTLAAAAPDNPAVPVPLAVVS